MDGFFGAIARSSADGPSDRRLAKSDGSGDEERENAPSLLSASFSSSLTTVHDAVSYTHLTLPTSDLV